MISYPESAVKLLFFSLPINKSLKEVPIISVELIKISEAD